MPIQTKSKVTPSFLKALLNIKYQKIHINGKYLKYTWYVFNFLENLRQLAQCAHGERKGSSMPVARLAEFQFSYQAVPNPMAYWKCIPWGSSLKMQFRWRVLVVVAKNDVLHWNWSLATWQCHLKSLEKLLQATGFINERLQKLTIITRFI